MNLDESYTEYYVILEDQFNFVSKLMDNHPEIANSIQRYSSRDYIKMNKETRAGIENKDMKNILKALNSVPPITEPLVVWRGKQTDVIRSEQPTVVSTSYNKDIAYKFAGTDSCCILKITVSPGTRLLPISDLSQYGTHLYHGNNDYIDAEDYTVPYDEQEILLEPNGTFIITGSSIDDDGMKIIYTTYLPPQNLQKTNFISQIKDPKDKDKRQIVERVVEYFSTRLFSEEELRRVMKENNFSLSEDDIDIIKWRLA